MRFEFLSMITFLLLVEVSEEQNDRMCGITYGRFICTPARTYLRGENPNYEYYVLMRFRMIMLKATGSNQPFMGTQASNAKKLKCC